MRIIRCAICNGPAEESAFRESPLLFFFTDQKIYIPGGIGTKEFKSFPLCEKCYQRLQRGQYFVREHLDFSVSNPSGGPSGLRFWLVPIIGDPTLAEEYLKHLKAGPLYLKNLKYTCETLGTIQEELARDVDVETEEELKSILTFTAWFYNYDKQGHMRVISTSEGIYPAHLRKKIVGEKFEIEKLYPYFLPPQIRFGFPLLKDFWAYRGGIGWQKELAGLLSNIFLASKINSDNVYSVLIARIQKELQGRRRSEVGRQKLESLRTLSLRALMVVEYLEAIGVISMHEGSVELEVEPAVENPLTRELLKFLNSHKKVILPGAVRAICCIGVAVGIVLVEQERAIRSKSFWGRLNRLELDFERVRRLFPQAIEKLHQYKVIEKYEDLITHMAAREVSNLDEEKSKEMSNDLASLVFTIGLGEGYLIAKKHEKKTEEVEQK